MHILITHTHAHCIHLCSLNINVHTLYVHAHCIHAWPLHTYTYVYTHIVQRDVQYVYIHICMHAVAMYVRKVRVNTKCVN